MFAYGSVTMQTQTSVYQLLSVSESLYQVENAEQFPHDGILNALEEKWDLPCGSAGKNLPAIQET